MRDNLRDICAVLYSTDVSMQPIFVAQSLAKLPPITTQDYGVGKILRELDCLKMAVSKIKGLSHANTDDTCIASTGLLHDIPGNPQLKVDTTSQVNLTDHVGSVTANRIVPNKPCKSTQVSPTVTVDVCCSVASSNCEDLVTIDYDPCSSTHSSGSSISMYSDISSGDFSVLDLEDTATDSNPNVNFKAPEHIQDWKQVRRTRPWGPNNHNFGGINGTGKSTGVRSAVKSKNFGNHENRYITGVFITRLDPYTTPKQLFLHIKRETGFTCYPEKLQTKYGGYSSFYVAADKKLCATIMDSQLWPTGTLFKPFYS
jgi:hypothetical protein